MEEDRLQSVVDLVRRIRHDANNPLTAALGHVQLLLENPAVQDADAREDLRVVERELLRLGGILKGLSEVGKP